MNRRQVSVVVLSVLAVVTLSIAAATIQTPVTTPGSNGGGSSGTNATGNQPPRFQFGIDVPVLGLGSKHSVGNESRNETAAKPPNESGNAAGGGGSELLSPSVPTALIALFAVVLVVGAVIALRNRGDEREESDESRESEAESDDQGAVANIGQTAGEAATRITETDATPENAIYRAWYEMTRHLDIADPATTTPGQFESAAHDAGMNPSDVADLTTQFESVRYGDESLSDDRTDRAVSALRRIEAEYANGTEQTEWLDDADGTEGEDG